MKVLELCMMVWILLLTQYVLIHQWDPNADKCYKLNSTELVYFYDCTVKMDKKTYLHVACDMFCILDDDSNLQKEQNYLLISWVLKSDRPMLNMSDPICLWMSNITITKTILPIRTHGTQLYVDKIFQKYLHLLESIKIDIFYTSNKSRMAGVAIREGNCDIRSSHFSLSSIDDNKNTSCKLKTAGIADMVFTENWFNVTKPIIDTIDDIYTLFLLHDTIFNLLRFEFSNKVQFQKSLFFILNFFKVIHLELLKTTFNSLGNRDFPYLPDLKELSFSKGEIESIEEEALDSFPNLNVLDLSFNTMQSIPDLFYKENRTMLKELNMKGNKPKEDRLFILDSRKGYNPHLLILILSETPIRVLKKESFASFPRLTELCLEQCSLNNLDTEAFHNLSSLLTLNLAINNIYFLPAKIFSHLTSLKSLNLRRNRLTTILLQIIPSIYTLTWLNLENSNGLSISLLHNVSTLTFNYKIQRSFLEELLKHTSLTHLDLSENLITIISQEMQFALRNIKRVNISMNPFDCSPCPLYLVSLWLTKPNAESPNLFFCSTPNKLKGEEINKLQSNEESCSYDYSLTIGLLISFSIILSCLTYFFRTRIWRFIKGVVCKQTSETNDLEMYYSL